MITCLLDRMGLCAEVNVKRFFVLAVLLISKSSSSSLFRHEKDA
jgi:hypothetical protein